MKVLLVTTHMNIGGIGVYTLNLARYISSYGASVSVLSSGGELEEELALAGIEHIKLDIKTKSEFGFKVLANIPAFLKVVKKNKFDVLHGQTRVSHVMCFFASKILNIPYVSTCHGFYNNKRLGRRLLGAWGDRTIAISKAVRDHLIYDFNVTPDNVYHVRTGVISAYYAQVERNSDNIRKSLNIGDDDIIVGSVGRLVRLKGYDILIRAFVEVLKINNRLKLIIVGFGQEEENLRKLSIECGISDNIIFVNGKRHKLASYLANMDIFCITSRVEGLGLVLMEAMAAGSACIGVNVGGIGEIIDNMENGILVKPGDIYELSQTIKRLVNDSVLRKKLAFNARKKALADFTIEESAEKTFNVYKEAVGAAKL